MWSTLEQTNVNDFIRPFGIQFGGESPDPLAGGHTKAGPITDKSLKSRITAPGRSTVALRLASTTDLTPIRSAYSRRWETAGNLS